MFDLRFKKLKIIIDIFPESCKFLSINKENTMDNSMDNMTAKEMRRKHINRKRSDGHFVKMFNGYPKNSKKHRIMEIRTEESWNK